MGGVDATSPKALGGRDPDIHVCMTKDSLDRGLFVEPTHRRSCNKNAPIESHTKRVNW